MPKSYKPEVKVVDDPKWYSNTLRFATEAEAKRSADNLMRRWTSTVDARAAESDDPVNAVLGADGRLVLVKEGQF